MWNAFTSPWPQGRRALAAILSLGLISGCVGSLPMPRQDQGQRAEKSASNAAKPGAAATRLELADLNVPTPKVKGRNAEVFAQAVAAMKRADYAAAEPLLRQVTNSQPELAGPWVNLGQVYLKLDNIEEARLAFRRAIAANPANCAAYNQLGVLSRQMGAFDEAENHYLTCLSANPRSADVYLNLGILYELYLGRLDEALSAYRQYQSLSIEPDRKVAGWVLDLERRTGS